MSVYLLDTDAYSQLKRGHARTSALVRSASTLWLSTVVVGELLYGFRHGSRVARNVEELRAFMDSSFVEIAPVTTLTSDRYSRIAATLRRKGRPIPTNDIWIAAHAVETGAELLSFDDHFEHVDGLIWTRLLHEPDSDQE